MDKEKQPRHWRMTDESEEWTRRSSLDNVRRHIKKQLVHKEKRRTTYAAIYEYKEWTLRISLNMYVVTEERGERTSSNSLHIFKEDPLTNFRGL